MTHLLLPSVYWIQTIHTVMFLVVMSIYYCYKYSLQWFMLTCWWWLFYNYYDTFDSDSVSTTYPIGNDVNILQRYSNNNSNNIATSQLMLQLFLVVIFIMTHLLHCYMLYPWTYIYTFPMSQLLKLLHQIHTSINIYICCWLIFNNDK